MNEVSVRRLLGFSLALLLGTAPTAAFAATGAVSPVVEGAQEVVEEQVEPDEQVNGLKAQEIADEGTDEGQTDPDAPSTEQKQEETPEEEPPIPEEPKLGVFVEGGKQYYRLSADSVLTGAGWHRIGSSWYYAKAADGALATGWQKLGGKWYWLDPDTCTMATGVTAVQATATSSAHLARC